MSNPSAHPFVYDYTQRLPLPPEADSEVLSILAETRGRAAVDELDGALGVLDIELQKRFRAIRSGESVREHLPAALDVVARRGIYVGRAAALRRLLKMKAVDVQSRGVPDLLRVLGEYPDQDVRIQVAANAGALRSQRDRAAAELADLKAMAADAARYPEAGFRGSYYGHRLGEAEKLAAATRSLLFSLTHNQDLAGALPKLRDFPGDAAQVAREVDRHRGPGELTRLWPQDGLITRLSEALGRVRSIEGRLAVLERDQAAATAAVAQRVRDAITAASGRETIASAVLAAEHLADRLPADLAGLSTRVRSTEAERKTAEGDWDRLALALGDAFNGPAADGLRAKQAATAAAEKAARAELVDRHAALAAELVDRAAEGVEPARARIEELTRLAPDAFPAGFGPAIAAARFDLAAAAELVETLQAA